MVAPNVSIIVPVYNQSRYIGDCLRSVLQQTYAEWELVVVDDGSDDSTRDRLGGFDDPRIRCIFQSHLGVSTARNTGLEESSGEYIAFLDADDLFHANRLERQVARMEACPEMGICYTSRVHIHRDGYPLDLHRPEPEIDLRQLVLGFPFAPSDILLRRGLIDQVGGFDCLLAVNEDRDLFLRLAIAGHRFGRLDEFLGFHRFYPNRVYQRLSERLDDKLNVLDHFFGGPDCGDEVREVRQQAYRNVYRFSALQAVVAGQEALSEAYWRKAVAFDGPVTRQKVDNLVNSLIETASQHENDHEWILRRALGGLPKELGEFEIRADAAVASGYLRRGIRELAWERTTRGRKYLQRAVAMGARVDGCILAWWAKFLAAYECGVGALAAASLATRLVSQLEEIGGRRLQDHCE